jgi:hypothetical protein
MHPTSCNGSNRLFGDRLRPDVDRENPSPGSGAAVAEDEHHDPAHGPENPQPSAAEGNGRDSRGRFAKGNRGGPGNPFARQVASLRKALLDAVSEDDMREVARALIERARSGDPAAAKLLFQYVLGKPAEAVDPDRLDQDEWRLFQERPVAPDELVRVLGGFPADLACEVLRAALPGVSEGLAQLLAGQLVKKEAQQRQRATAAQRRWERGETAATPEPAVGPEEACTSETNHDESPTEAAMLEGEAPAVPVPTGAGLPTDAAVDAVRKQLSREDAALQVRVLASLFGLPPVPPANPGPRSAAPMANGDDGGPPPKPNGPDGEPGARP